MARTTSHELVASVADSAPRFVATAPLFIGRARAANPGDEVPAASVEKYGWGGKVRKVSAGDIAPESTVPAKSASKGDWVAYATSQARGEEQLTTEQAEALTKDQLADMFLD